MKTEGNGECSRHHCRGADRAEAHLRGSEEGPKDAPKVRWRGPNISSASGL